MGRDGHGHGSGRPRPWHDPVTPYLIRYGARPIGGKGMENFWIIQGIIQAIAVCLPFLKPAWPWFQRR
jgi:hypothetical protein